MWHPAARRRSAAARRRWRCPTANPKAGHLPNRRPRPRPRSRTRRSRRECFPPQEAGTLLLRIHRTRKWRAERPPVPRPSRARGCFLRLQVPQRAPAARRETPPALPQPRPRPTRWRGRPPVRNACPGPGARPRLPMRLRPWKAPRTWRCSTPCGDCSPGAAACWSGFRPMPSAARSPPRRRCRTASLRCRPGTMHSGPRASARRSGICAAS